MTTNAVSSGTERIHIWGPPDQRDRHTKKLKVSQPSELESAGRDQQWSSPLLCLPMEIKQKIYDSIFTDWSLAIFDSPGIHQEHQLRQQNQQRDETIMLRPVGSKLVSGPPGCNLMLACRDTYYSVRDRYGGKFTGKLYIGNVKRRLHSTLGLYFLQLSRLRRWYRRVTSLSVSFNINIAKLNFQILKLLPRLQFVDVLIYSTNHDLLDRPASRISDAILRGRHDVNIVDQANNALGSFFGDSAIWGLIHQQVNRTPVLSRIVSIEVKLVHWQWHEMENVLGFHYRRKESGNTVINRVVRDSHTVRYCGEGMGSGIFADIATKYLDEDESPEQLQWVRIEVDEFLNG